MSALPNEPTRCRPCVAALALAALSALLPARAGGACDPLCPGPTLELRQLLDRPPSENVLKLFSAAVDDPRHRLYVAGALTRAIAVYDTEASAFVDWLDGGVGGELTHKFLFGDDAAHDLWIVDATREELRRIDLDTGELLGPVAIGPFFGHAVVDPGRRRLVVSGTEAPTMRAFDGATLATAWSTNALGAGTGALAYDPAADAILVLDLADRTASRQIHRLRASDGAVLSDLTYTAETNSRSVTLDRDPSTGELWVGNDRAILVVGAAGTTLRQASIAGAILEDAVFDAEHGRYLALLEMPPENGEVDTASTRLRAYDRTTLVQVADLAMGRKTHRMVLSAGSDAVYAPNGDLSTLWRVATPSLGAATAIRLGESLESIVPAADGMVYAASRLGGSEVHAVDPTAGTATAFASGAWPYPLLGNAAGDILYVLDFWDGTLSVFDLLPSRSLRARIPVGLPRGTTDRLPDMAIDEGRGLAFAAFPEHGKVAVVDLAAQTALAALTVPTFQAGAAGGGPGDLQLAVASASGVLFVLAADHQRLHRYDLDAGRALIGTSDLSALDWSWAGNVADRNNLYVDEARGVLFVGPHEVSLATAQSTGRRLTGSRQILGPRDDDELWSYGLDAASGQFRLEPVAWSTLAPSGDGLAVGDPETLVYVPYLDRTTGTVWLGDQVRVELTPYTVEEPGGGGGGGGDPTCTATTTAMCLAGDRFRVSARFRRPTDTADGDAQTVRLTSDTGYLWFFRAENVELIVKVLDGRPVNGAFWVFAAPLSNVAWTLEVEDTAIGAVRSYVNPQGSVTVVSDTTAFPASP